jgi:hypothetical protein
MQLRIKYKILFIAGMLMAATGCTKLVQVPEPVDTITTSETFSSDGNANSALAGIYYDMSTGYNGSIDWGNGYLTFCAGQSADELVDYDQSNPGVIQFQDNTLQSNNPYLANYIWAAPYSDIYAANAAIEQLPSASAVSAGLRTQLLGEAEFLRAYCYFYLVNLFENVPLVTTTAWATTKTLPAAPAPDVYRQIVVDLESAQGLLNGDYSASGGERIRANKWAATAMLSRVYLYMNNWVGADSAATAVIANGGLYQLTDLNSVFLANSQEAIWQLQPNNASFYATWEGESNLPQPLNSGNPYYILTPKMIAAFEPGDQRWIDWVDSTNYGGQISYYPFKYKVETASSGNVPEYYMMLRLGEQYLIRAEAEAHGAGGGITAAIADLNVIRQRAQLPPYGGLADSTSVLPAIMHERQIELFAEKGNRWLDLKRWGLATNILGVISYKQPWDPNNLLYPIPIGEIQTDPNLKQNLGY